MSDAYDVIVIGGGLGGLTAAALLARAGRKTLLIERHLTVGGAASTYRVGDLTVEGSLHATSDPHDPRDPKHGVLARLGVLDAVEWVPTGDFYEVRGRPLGEPFVLPDGFAAARQALNARFPSATAGIGAVLGDMERIAAVVGILSQGRAALRNPRDAIAVLARLPPLVTGWRRSLGDRLRRAFGDDEAVKFALAANLGYYHDDPETLWWIFFALAQGSYLASGGRYIRGGSHRLSEVIARAFTAAGGELLLGRSVNEILIDAHGRTCGVAHASGEGRERRERGEARARVVIGNAAPAALADMLPAPARERFTARYGQRALSIALFALTLGLAVRPCELGLRHYSTFLLPSWMRRLADFGRASALMAQAPGNAMPPFAVVDYAAIDSGLGGPPYPVSVVGADRVANWAGLDGPAFDSKRDRWRDAIIAAIDREFPGFAAKVVASVFSPASAMSRYLNAPAGAIYGFAPLPPAGAIWKGPPNSPRTPIDGLYLASSYAGSGGFTGAIISAAQAAEQVLSA